MNITILRFGSCVIRSFWFIDQVTLCGAGIILYMYMLGSQLESYTSYHSLLLGYLALHMQSLCFPEERSNGLINFVKERI